jgi:glutamate-1-semialdehyde 2,1-aminomutase
MIKHGIKTQAFFDHAMDVMPHGVSSNYRFYGKTSTPVVERGEGAYVYDLDGKRWIDYRLGWGPVLLGHADPFVNGRVKEAIDKGLSFAGTQPYEVSVAERIIDLCPGVEMVRLANTGSECTMHAIRLARGYTGRDVVLKFEGSYHGAHDSVLWSTMGADVAKVGERVAPVAYKVSAGIPEMMRDLVQICPWNDVEILGDILQKRGHEIACIIVEPLLGNANALMPDAGFHQFLREQCDQYGIVLIFDEVKTGFRIAPGGARELFGVMPDISTYAKAMGNGYPIAAMGGKKELMMSLGPGGIFQGGTYTGNVVSTAAADATLERIQTGEVFATLNARGTALQTGIHDILDEFGVPHFINGTPAMFGLCIAEKKPRDWRELKEECDWDMTRAIYSYMNEHGVLPEPGGLEPFFLSSAHSQADIDETLQQFAEGVKFALK